MRGNEREATIGTAHTVTVNSLIESNKQTTHGQPRLSLQGESRDRKHAGKLEEFRC
jgi:hypothetical protein